MNALPELDVEIHPWMPASLIERNKNAAVSDKITELQEQLGEFEGDLDKSTLLLEEFDKIIDDYHLTPEQRMEELKQVQESVKAFLKR